MCLNNQGSDDVIARNMKLILEILTGAKGGFVWGSDEMEVAVGHLANVSSRPLVTSSFWESLGQPGYRRSRPLKVSRKYWPKRYGEIRLNQTFDYEVSAHLIQQRVPWTPSPRNFQGRPIHTMLPLVCDVAGVLHSH